MDDATDYPGLIVPEGHVEPVPRRVPDQPDRRCSEVDDYFE